jgi:hypothetical protein
MPAVRSADRLRGDPTPTGVWPQGESAQPCAGDYRTAQSESAVLIRWMSSRSSRLTLGLPGRPRDFQPQ